MSHNVCPRCKLPLVPRGEQVFPDRHSGAWYAIRLGDCPRCQSTRAYGSRRELGVEEARARGLPDLRDTDRR